MSLADLQSALENIDDQILELSAKCADPRAYTIEGLTVARQRIEELLRARKMLQEQVVGEGSQIYEVRSREVP